MAALSYASQIQNIKTLIDSIYTISYKSLNELIKKNKTIFLNQEYP